MHVEVGYRELASAGEVSALCLFCDERVAGERTLPAGIGEGHCLLLEVRTA